MSNRTFCKTRFHVLYLRCPVLNMVSLRNEFLILFNFNKFKFKQLYVAT